MLAKGEAAARAPCRVGGGGGGGGRSGAGLSSGGWTAAVCVWGGGTHRRSGPGGRGDGWVQRRPAEHCEGVVPCQLAPHLQEACRAASPAQVGPRRVAGRPPRCPTIGQRRCSLVAGQVGHDFVAVCTPTRRCSLCGCVLWVRFVGAAACAGSCGVRMAPRGPTQLPVPACCALLHAAAIAAPSWCLTFLLCGAQGCPRRQLARAARGPPHKTRLLAGNTVRALADGGRALADVLGLG